MRKDAPLSELKRKDGMISLEHCQEWILFMLLQAHWVICNWIIPIFTMLVTDVEDALYYYFTDKSKILAIDSLHIQSHQYKVVTYIVVTYIVVTNLY